MAQRRPITTHPAFVPLVALWFAALFGLGIAVLPAVLVERALGAIGLDAMAAGASGRMVASGVAALAGGLLGLVVAMAMARRGRGDPRPVYAEQDAPLDHPLVERAIRRPLRVREELDEGMAPAPPAEPVVEMSSQPSSDVEDEETIADTPAAEPVAGPIPPAIAENDEGFMILTPQPVHPPRPAPDLDALLEQFDTAIAAFRATDEPAPVRAPTGSDPVHAFLAKQTGTPAPSPLGGRMPDHQAELRAALDKLARAHRKD